MALYWSGADNNMEPSLSDAAAFKTKIMRCSLPVTSKPYVLTFYVCIVAFSVTTVASFTVARSCSST